MKKTILLTRPRAASERTAELLRHRGFACVIEPLLMIEHTHAPRPEGVFGAVWITSSSAADLLKSPDQDISDLFPLPCFCRGVGTGEAAQEAGFQNIHKGASDVDLARQTLDALKGKAMSILYICGEIVDQKAQTLLRENGLALRKWPLYRAATLSDFSPETKARFVRGDFAALSAFSRRSAQTLVSLIEKNNLTSSCAAIIAIGLSQAAADVLKKLPWKELRVAAKPEEEEILASL